METEASVGVHFSGGLDSSSIAVLAARKLRLEGRPVPSLYSWQPSPKGNLRSSSEHDAVETICRNEGLSMQYCPANAKDILTVLAKDPAIEPIETTLYVETTVQNAAAENGETLLLSGWGGDESLSYGTHGAYHADLLLRGRWRRLYKELGFYGSPSRLFAMEALVLLFRDRAEGMKKISERSFRALVRPESLVAPAYAGRSKLVAKPHRQTNPKRTLFWLWKKGKLAERMESWHASGTSKGISYAYPMLDRRLMEFVAGLPPEQFIRGKWRRWIMRNAMEGILPEEVSWQTDKSDPIRVKNAKTEFYIAFAVARERLLERVEVHTRSRYLNMPKLMEQLSPEVLEGRPKLMNLRSALQFLDF